MAVAMVEKSPLDDLVGGMRPLHEIPRSTATGPLDLELGSRTSAPIGEGERVTPRTGKAATPATTSFLNGFSLFGISQMLNLESKSCLVEVAHAGLRGRLVFSNGNVVDAELGDIRGDRAAELMLAWQQPTVWIHETSAPARVTVTKPVTQLLLESLRKLDELAHRQSQIAQQADRREDSPVSLVADAALRLTAMARTRGVLAVAIVDTKTRSLLAHAASVPGFEVERSVSEVAEAATVQALASRTIEEIRISGTDALHVLRPIEQGRSACLYLALDRSASNPARTIRRLTKLSISLIS